MAVLASRPGASPSSQQQPQQQQQQQQPQSHSSTHASLAAAAAAGARRRFGLACVALALIATLVLNRPPGGARSSVAPLAPPYPTAAAGAASPSRVAPAVQPTSTTAESEATKRLDATRTRPTATATAAATAAAAAAAAVEPPSSSFYDPRPVDTTALCADLNDAILKVRDVAAPHADGTNPPEMRCLVAPKGLRMATPVPTTGSAAVNNTNNSSTSSTSSSTAAAAAAAAAATGGDGDGDCCDDSASLAAGGAVTGQGGLGCTGSWRELRGCGAMAEAVLALRRRDRTRLPEELFSLVHFYFNAEDLDAFGHPRLLKPQDPDGGCLIHRSVTGSDVVALEKQLTAVATGEKGGLVFVGTSHVGQAFATAVALMVLLPANAGRFAVTSVRGGGYSDTVVTDAVTGSPVAVFAGSITAAWNDMERALRYFEAGKLPIPSMVALGRGKWDLTMNSDAADVQDGVAATLDRLDAWVTAAAAKRSPTSNNSTSSAAESTTTATAAVVVDVVVYAPHTIHDGHRPPPKPSRIGRCSTPDRTRIMRDAVACGVLKHQQQTLSRGRRRSFAVRYVDVSSITATPEARHLSDGHHFEPEVAMNIIARLFNAADSSSARESAASMTPTLLKDDGVTAGDFYTVPSPLPESAAVDGSGLCDQCLVLSPRPGFVKAVKSGSWPCRVHRAKLYLSCFNATAYAVAEPRDTASDANRIEEDSELFGVAVTPQRDACAMEALIARRQSPPSPGFDVR